MSWRAGAAAVDGIGWASSYAPVLQLLKGDLVVEQIVESGGTAFTAQIPLLMPKPLLVSGAGRHGHARSGAAPIYCGVQPDLPAGSVSPLVKGIRNSTALLHGYAVIEATSIVQYRPRP